MDRFWLCEVDYPKPEAEELLMEKAASKLPEQVRKKMVKYAGEVRRLFMGEKENSHSGNSIEVTFSTRTLLRWTDLTVRYQPLAKQGIQPVEYALDRAFGFRASRENQDHASRVGSAHIPRTRRQTSSRGVSRDIAAELERSKDASVQNSPINASATKLVTQSLDALNACLKSDS